MWDWALTSWTSSIPSRNQRSNPTGWLSSLAWPSSPGRSCSFPWFSPRHDPQRVRLSKGAWLASSAVLEHHLHSPPAAPVKCGACCSPWDSRTAHSCFTGSTLWCKKRYLTSSWFSSPAKISSSSFWSFTESLWYSASSRKGKQGRGGVLLWCLSVNLRRTMWWKR